MTGTNIIRNKNYSDAKKYAFGFCQMQYTLDVEEKANETK